MNHVRMMLSLLAAGVCCATSVSDVFADTIRLKSAALVDEKAPITLVQIAELEGPKAAALADVVIAKSYADLSKGAWAMLDVEQLRALLLKRDDVAWASVELSGSAVTIRTSRAPAEATPNPSESEKEAVRPSRNAEPILGSDAGVETVRGQVIAHLADELHASTDDLRLTFETIDARLLDTALTNRTAVVQVLGAGAKVPVAVRVLEGDKTVASGTIRVGTLVRTPVAVMHRAVARHEIIEEAHFLIEDRWIAPGQDFAAPARLVGSSVRQRIAAGAIVREADLEEPEVIAKGDVVAVDCVAGSVVLTQRARALQSGKKGEVIELESLSPKLELADGTRGGKAKIKAGPKSKFRARIDGPGRAIAVAAGTDGGPGVPMIAPPLEASDESPTMATPDPSELAKPADATTPPVRKRPLKFSPIKDGR